MADETEDRLANVRFDLAVVNSEFIRPLRMYYRQRGHDLYWDMALGHDSVAALIYHTGNKQLLFVKQFRPPVFINMVRSMPENKGKALSEVRWEDYPAEIGCTIELCAGLIDEPNKTPMEILEECGYKVDAANIRPIRRYVTGISLSGAIQHFFYVELDESMREPKAGGGNEHEGEFIQNVFMHAAEAEAFLEKENMLRWGRFGPKKYSALRWYGSLGFYRTCIIFKGTSPSFLFGISWWLLNEKERLIKNGQ